MKRNIVLYLQDIIDYSEKAEKYVTGIDFDDFLNDEKTCDAVIRCIEVIGEATKSIPDDIREKYPSVPWRNMAGMRDKIIHSYFIVDYEAVWLVIKRDIPTLKPLIAEVLDYVKKL